MSSQPLPDPPCAHGLTGGRGAAERCLGCGASVTAASPDERLREAGERLANLVTLLGGYDGPGYLAAPNQGEHPDYYAAAKLFDRIMRDEKTGAAVVLAQWRAALAAVDREAPDEWPTIPSARMVDAALVEARAEEMALTPGGAYRLLYAALNARPPVDPDGGKR